MTEKAKEVFISYSTKDTDIAYALLETLESYGLDCWIAPRNIPQGAQWAEEIDKAIQNARVFVVIVSSHSVESRQVPKEIALAVSACESIFPFRIDDISLQGTFRYYLSDYQFTDATSNTKQKMRELADVICSSLGKPASERKTEEIPDRKAYSEAEAENTSNEKPGAAPHSMAGTASGIKSKKPLWIGMIAAAAVLAVILGIVLSGGKGKKDETAGNPDSDAVQESAADDSVSEDSTAEEGDTTESTAAGSTAAESDTAEGDAAEKTAPESLSENSAEAFGVWKKIAYEDRGAETDIRTDDLYILGDGTPYFSLEDGLAGTSPSALTPDQLLEDSGKYDVTVETSFKDAFDGSISDKSSGMPSFTSVEYKSLFGTGLAEENPTGRTFEECYPEQYYFVHLTGTYKESPVKQSDVDTWIVYKKKYPVFSDRIFPVLAGRWKDEMGNLWEFSVKDGDLAFTMTDSGGNTYKGVGYTHFDADKETVNFFERIRFEFEEYKTDYYAVLAFDGQKLEMLDQDWNSFVLIREG